MLNTTNYFTNNSGPKVTANTTILKNSVPTSVTITYSSVGADFKNIFTNNSTTLGNIITAIHSSESGVYFANGNTHIRKDVHYNG